MDIYAELKKIISNELSLEEASVLAEAHLQDDLGADSLALLNLAEAIAARFGIEIKGDDLVEIATVGELANFVASRTSSAR